MKKHNVGKGILVFVLIVGLVLVGLFCGLKILESRIAPSKEQDLPETPTKTITRGESKYFPRQDITVMMVLGIDQYGPVKSSEYYRNDGAADSIMLLIFDETNEDCTIVYLNRDMMLDMDVLGVRGDYAGTRYGQLALAHTYGTGLEDSCENTRNTIEKNFLGINIDYYVAMNMDAIPILNDAVGGVKVNVVDDFSKVDPTITMGEVTLTGNQVINFVRTRKDVGDQTNSTRMERQKEYVNSFMQSLYAKEHEEVDFLLNFYEQVAPYIVSDCSVKTLSGMINRYVDYEIKEVVSLDGESKIVDGHYQFYADEQAMEELILRLFYKELIEE